MKHSLSWWGISKIGIFTGALMLSLIHIFQNAASASAMLLTTEAGVVDIKEDAPAMPQMGGQMGGMGGMM